MKGLPLSEEYYIECGKMVFETRFKSLMERVAVGLVGPGSECLGFDDEHSRDHDWGPGFCLWLTSQDFQRYGKEFQDCYNALPKTFNGFGPRIMSSGETGRVGPMEIKDFYLRYTGLSKPPQTLSEWDIPSPNMSLCTNGQIFSDSLKEFSSWRKTLLQFYPEDLRLKKIADCCMHAGQSGQYNWQRGILRKDPFVITTAKNKFCTEIINLVYLLNKTYAPYFKWLFVGVKQLPVLGKELSPYIGKLLGINDELTEKQDWKSQQDIVSLICERIINELQNQDITDAGEVFLIDHVPLILNRITDLKFKHHLWGGR